MSIRTKIVPWSSVVGQSVLLLDETGRAVAQLAIRISAGAAGDHDIKTCAGHVAKHVERAFAALADDHRALARLMAVLHLNDVLTEGQLASITGWDRVSVRKAVDEGRDSLLIDPPKAAFLKAVMAKAQKV